MKTATIGDLVVGRHVDTLTLLDMHGFNLGKKVFHKAHGDGSKSYYQAENAREDRFLRLSSLESFFLEREKTEVVTAAAEGDRHVRSFR